MFVICSSHCLFAEGARGGRNAPPFSIQRQVSLAKLKHVRHMQNRPIQQGTRRPHAPSRRIAVLALLICLFTGCALTAPRLSSQALPDVLVTLNYLDPVLAPSAIPLGEAFGHELTIQIPGYKPLFFSLKRTEAGWGWRNVNFGGRVMLGIDLAFGEVFLLTDAQCVAAHSGLTSQNQLQTDHIYVVIAHDNSDDWRKIRKLYADMD